MVILRQDRQVSASSTGAHEAWTKYTVGIGLALAALVLLAQCILYLGTGAFLDHIEGNVLIEGWQYLHGMPLYEIEDGAPRFAAYYGPLAYLATLPGTLLLGPGIGAAKLLFVIAPLMTAAVLAPGFFRRRTLPALAALLYLISGLLIFCPVAYWMRPDPLETLLVAVAVILCPLRYGAVGVGICLGIMANLKLHAFAYAIPVLFDLLQRRGWRAAALAVTSSVGVFLLPFLAPGIAFTDYRFALSQHVGTRAPEPGLALDWLLYSVLLSVPLLAALAYPGASVTRGDRRYAWTTIGVQILLGYPAAFPGAGAYHLMPLLPVFADAFCRLLPYRPLPLLVPLALLVLGLANARPVFGLILALNGLNAEAQEAVQIAAANPGIAIQVGYGETERTYKVSQVARALLSLRGRTVLIDAQVLMELRYIGVDGSRRWLPLVEACGQDGWLIPHNETPFTVRSFYDRRPVFDDEFRATFQMNYHLQQTGQYFDLWRCDAAAGGTSGD